MEKIKIVRVISRLNIGGPAINAAILSSCLDKTLFETKLLYGSLAEGEGDMSYLLEGGGGAAELIPELGREISIFNDLRAFWKIVRILRREKPQIVHTHTAKSGMLGRLAAVLCGVPIRIHTFHGNVFRSYFGRIKTSLFIAFERILAALSTRIIAISQRQKFELVDEYRIVSEDKCDIVPLGIDPTRLTEDCRARGLKEELGLEGLLTVGILGRLVPIKNHEMFLHVASRVSKNWPDLKVAYLVIGDGESKQVLEDSVRSMDLGATVRFLGWRSDLSRVYRGLDIVALTSLNEGTPVALIEAMTCGKAIIATDVGGVADIIQDGVNGLLVRSGDVAAFSERLASLLSDDALRRRLGEAGRKRSVAFRQDRLVKDMTRIYLRCMADICGHTRDISPEAALGGGRQTKSDGQE